MRAQRMAQMLETEGEKKKKQRRKTPPRFLYSVFHTHSFSCVLVILPNSAQLLPLRGHGNNPNRHALPHQTPLPLNEPEEGEEIPF